MEFKRERLLSVSFLGNICKKQQQIKQIYAQKDNLQNFFHNGNCNDNTIIYNNNEENDSDRIMAKLLKMINEKKNTKDDNNHNKSVILLK